MREVVLKGFPERDVLYPIQTLDGFKLDHYQKGERLVLKSPPKLCKRLVLRQREHMAFAGSGSLLLTVILIDDDQEFAGARSGV